MFRGRGCHSMHMETRGKLAEVSSLPPCRLCRLLLNHLGSPNIIILEYVSYNDKKTVLSAMPIYGLPWEWMKLLEIWLVHLSASKTLFGTVAVTLPASPSPMKNQCLSVIHVMKGSVSPVKLHRNWRDLWKAGILADSKTVNEDFWFAFILFR